MTTTRSTSRETIDSIHLASNPSPSSPSPSPTRASLASLPAELKLAIVDYVLIDSNDVRGRDARCLSDKMALWTISREFRCLTTARRWESLTLLDQPPWQLERLVADVLPKYASFIKRVSVAFVLRGVEERTLPMEPPPLHKRRRGLYLDIIRMLPAINNFHLGGLPDCERSPFLRVVSTLPLRLETLRLGNGDYLGSEWNLIGLILELQIQVRKLTLNIWSWRGRELTRAPAIRLTNALHRLTNLQHLSYRDPLLDVGATHRLRQLELDVADAALAYDIISNVKETLVDCRLTGPSGTYQAVTTPFLLLPSLCTLSLSQHLFALLPQLDAPRLWQLHHYAVGQDHSYIVPVLELRSHPSLQLMMIGCIASGQASTQPLKQWCSKQGVKLEWDVWRLEM